MKSRIGVNDEKESRQTVQLFSAPSPRKARRADPNHPIAQAAAATIGPNASQLCREPSSRFSCITGGFHTAGRLS